MSFNDSMNHWTQTTLDRVQQIDPSFACHAQFALNYIASQMRNCSSGGLSSSSLGSPMLTFACSLAPSCRCGGRGSCCLHPTPAPAPQAYPSPFHPPAFQWPFVHSNRPEPNPPQPAQPSQPFTPNPFRWPFAHCKRPEPPKAPPPPPQWCAPTLPHEPPTGVHWNYPTGLLSWYPRY